MKDREDRFKLEWNELFLYILDNKLTENWSACIYE